MKIEEWPNFITVKILQLEAQAKTLAAQAEVLTAQAECVRDEITGRTTTKAEPQALRAEFERLLKAASEAQARQQIEEGVLAVCRQWLDNLTADAKLEPVPIDVPADVTLASVRERLRAAQDEIVTLRRARSRRAVTSERASRIMCMASHRLAVPFLAVLARARN